MASALQPEIWHPNMPGVRELITYSGNVFYIGTFIRSDTVLLQCYVKNIFLGAWSSPAFSGTRPPPNTSFTLTSIDRYRALMFGGKEGERQIRVSDLYLVDFQTMVIKLCLYHIAVPVKIPLI